MLRQLFPATVVAVFAIAPSVGAQDADAAIDRAVALYGRMNTIRATFEQTLTNPLTGSTLRASGEFQRQQPNLISVRFTDPAGDRIVIDGRAIWVYLPSSNPGQVYRMPLASDAAGMYDPAQLMRAPRERYTVTDGGIATVGDRRTRLVTLVPKASDAAFASAKVWIDAEDGLIRQFEVTEPSGVTRHIRLITVQPNAAVERSTFTFRPPRGVEVIDRAGGP